MSSYYTFAKASSRSKQLQRYKGNWATIEIMKTLLKNRRTYRNRVGSLDEEQGMVKKEEGDDDDRNNGDDYGDDYGNNGDDDGNNDDDDGNNGGDDGNNGDDDGNGDDDDWENMYTAYKEQQHGRDEDDVAEDNGGDGNEGLEEGEDGNGRRIINGSRGGFGGKAIEGMGRGGTKRKATQGDEPATATRAKRAKRDGSGSHQVATQPTKKAPLKRNSSKRN